MQGGDSEAVDDRDRSELVEFTNATGDRYVLMITSLPHDYELTMQPFLSGAELLSTVWLSKLRSANAA